MQNKKTAKSPGGAHSSFVIDFVCLFIAYSIKCVEIRQALIILLFQLIPWGKTFTAKVVTRRHSPFFVYTALIHACAFVTETFDIGSSFKRTRLSWSIPKLTISTLISSY